MDRCANCEREIGRLETPFAWLGQVVCRHCHAVLSSPSLAPLEGPTRLNVDLPPVPREEPAPLEELALAAASARGGRRARGVVTHAQQQVYAYPPQAPAYPQPAHPQTAYTQSYARSASQPVIHIHNTNVQHAYHTPHKAWSPGVAALLSLLLPGLGQMYKGQPINGIIWLIVVAIGYVMLILPGAVLHLCCILGAASGNPYK